MATKAAERPGVSKLDPQPKMVAVDAALNEVSAGSEAAAFMYQPADLERVRARREELGYDDRERVQRESAKAELALAERNLARLQGQVDDLRAQVAEGSGDEGEKSASKSSKATKADEG